MKNNIFFILAIITFNCSIVFAQTKTDSISTMYLFGGITTKLNGKTMSIRKMNETLKINTEANKEWVIAKKNRRVCLLISLVGGGLLGASFGQYGIDKPGLFLLGASIGCIGISIPFQLKYNQHTKKAVSIYNSSLN